MFANNHFRVGAIASAIALTLLLTLPSAFARDASSSVLATASPESVGMSTERLKKIEAAFAKEVKENKLPGAVMMVARRGKLVYTTAVGKRDPKASDAMQADSLFRIYSMTKPIVGVAAMTLVEDGVLQLSDPVSKWLPPFKDIKVATANGTEPARAMTVQDVMRHTAGLAYGELTNNPAIKEALTKEGLYQPGVIDFDSRGPTSAELAQKLARVPLIYQPGTYWEYSFGTDVLGLVVEAVSGKRLGDFMAERIFRPLRMNDSGFVVPAEKKGRLTEPFEKDPMGGTPIRLIDVSKVPGNDSGGAGGISTAGDYLRFAQMLANGGTLGGKRILGRNTVKFMASDHLGSCIPIAQTPGGNVLGGRASYTFGLTLAVRPSDGLAAFPGSAGDFDWNGFAGTGFWVDPKEGIVAVFMVQSGGAIRGYHRNLFRQLVYAAITD